MKSDLPTGRVTIAHQCGHCSQLTGHSSNVIFGQAQGSHLSNKYQLYIEVGVTTNNNTIYFISNKNTKFTVMIASIKQNKHGMKLAIIYFSKNYMSFM